MVVLSKIPLYTERVIYPLNAVVATLVSLAFCIAGHKVLGRYGQYVGL